MEKPRPATLVLALVLGSCVCGCGGGSRQVSPAGEEHAGPQHASAHFIFHYTPADASVVAAVAAAADAEPGRITTDLGVAGMRQVHVYYYESRDAMAAAVRPTAGEIPSWATGLVTGPERIHLVSPAVLGQSVERAASSVVHEFAHCAALTLQPRAGNNPRWLWETVATYESRQFVDPMRLPYLVAHEPPGLNDLSSFSDRRVYDVGFLIGEFIVATWGAPALPRLITALGDTGAVLGVTAAEFERQWFESVKARYGI